MIIDLELAFFKLSLSVTSSVTIYVPLSPYLCFTTGP